MRRMLFIILLFCAVGVRAQNSSTPSGTPPANSQTPPASAPPSSAPDSSGPASIDPSFKPRSHNLPPPRSDRVSIEDLGDQPGDSSSKDTQIDLSPPDDDAKVHPQSAEALLNAELSEGSISQMHPWDPHKAAKDVEVGDFYFKRKNYRAAEDRYREALLYKPNDAVATFRLAVSLEKLDLPDSARNAYASYLKILPNGPQADEAKQAIARLNADDVKTPALNPKPNH